MCKKLFQNPIVKILGTLGLTALGVPAPLAAGGTTLAGGGDIKDAALAAGGSYLGAKVLGPMAGGGVPGPAGTIGSELTKAGLSDFAGSLPGSVATANLGDAAGSFIGSNLAQSIGGTTPKPSSMGGPGMFMPGRPSEMQTPESLRGLSPEQAASNIATRGLYGGGYGNEERNYFVNLLQRRLYDAGNFDSKYALDPLEEQYLRQGLGLSFGQTSRSLLESLSRYS